MTLTYSLTEYDFLQNQLFTASKTERIKDQRKRSWILISLCFFVFSLLSFNTDNYIFGYYFIGLGLLSSFFYPLYQGAYYRRHYQKYITETFKNRIDQTATITFTSARIECFDKTGEFKINLVEIEEIFETGEYFYLKIKSGVSLIIPKSKVENTDDLRTELMSISESLKVNYSIELNWRWK